MAKNTVNWKKTDGDPTVVQDNRERFTQQQVADALVAAGGVQTEAAKILGCSKTTLNGYIRRYPALQDVMHQAKEEMIDLAESQLHSKIKSGNMTAIIFFLKCQAKHRGYVEKGEVVQKAPEQSAVDLNNMTDEELRQLNGLLNSATNPTKPTRFDA
jgi:predicted transcriptional regulator